MQSIKFTLFAPSGSGGGFISELLDNQTSNEGDVNQGNIRTSAVNEYAGSPNLYRYYDYYTHEVIQEFPDFTEDTILYGKRHSPLNWFKNKVKSDTTYYVDTTGHEALMKDLVFVKKAIGSPILSDGLSNYLNRVCYKDIRQPVEEGLRYANNADALKLLDYKVRRVCQQIIPFMSENSFIASEALINSKLDPVMIDAELMKNFILEYYKRHINEKPAPLWHPDSDETREYTEIETIKYDDLLEGRDTGTELDTKENKKKLAEYFERNFDVLDTFYTSLNV